MAKHFIELLGLGKESQPAQKLLNYRNPKNARGVGMLLKDFMQFGSVCKFVTYFSSQDAGDFASVAYYILKPRCPEKGSMSIAEVNECLDRVAACNAAKDKEGLRKALMTMLRKQSAGELRWLTRMILKELKMGLSQASILRIYHQDAEDLYNVKMSLEKVNHLLDQCCRHFIPQNSGVQVHAMPSFFLQVCVMLKDPKTRLHEVEIAVFSPFRPMLGDRASPHKVGISCVFKHLIIMREPSEFL